MIGKFIVDGEGTILEIKEAQGDYVWVSEFDAQGGPKELRSLSSFADDENIVFFDSVMDAQKYVEENFEDEAAND